MVIFVCSDCGCKYQLGDEELFGSGVNPWRGSIKTAAGMGGLERFRDNLRGDMLLCKQCVAKAKKAREIAHEAGLRAERECYLSNMGGKA
jgi:hypothetical protein